MTGILPSSFINTSTIELIDKAGLVPYLLICTIA